MHFIPVIGDFVEIVTGLEKTVGYLTFLRDLGWVINLKNGDIKKFQPISTIQHILDDENFGGNIYDPIWKKLISIQLRIESATSGRTFCEVCKAKINKGYIRLNHIRKWCITTNGSV